MPLKTRTLTLYESEPSSFNEGVTHYRDSLLEAFLNQAAWLAQHRGRGTTCEEELNRAYHDLIFGRVGERWMAEIEEQERKASEGAD